MATEMPDEHNKLDATACTIECINNNENISRLIHDMLHSCRIVDEYLYKLNGLLRVFWGNATPKGKLLEEVRWLEVMVEILPTKCLIPIFKESALEIEEKQRDKTNMELWENIHKEKNDNKEEW
tara:strand:+ start:759 stop:1130 length:372 start_codon:yes stop_codon:yes gene_type:complete